MGYDDELKMEQNQLYLIKQLESKVKNLKKAIIEPEQYNVGLASKERLSELEERVEGLEK